MTSADFSQFVVTARLLSLKPRLRDLPSYGRTLSGLYPLGLLSAVRIVIGLLLLVQHCPCLSALYQVLVHRANRLPPTSFRFRLTADTLVFGCNLPTIRAVWGLAPIRARSCWANTIKGDSQQPPFIVCSRSSTLPDGQRCSLPVRSCGVCVPALQARKDCARNRLLALRQSPRPCGSCRRPLRSRSLN